MPFQQASIDEIQNIYDEVGESHPGEWPPPLPEAVPDESAEIDATGLFGDVVVRRYLWEVEHTAEQYILHLACSSNVRKSLPGPSCRLG